MCNQLFLSVSKMGQTMIKVEFCAKLKVSLLTFIEMNAEIGPLYTVIPVALTSEILPSNTSPCSGMQAIALKLTLKITSPEVS